MKLLRYATLVFGSVFIVLSLHYLLYDRDAKKHAIDEVASRMKHSELSLSFKEKAYKGFVYVH